MAEHWIRVDEREAELLNKMRESQVDLDELLNLLESTRQKGDLAAPTEKGVKTSAEVLESLIARVETLERRLDKEQANPARPENELYDEMLDNLKASTRIGELVRCLARTLLDEAGPSAKRKTPGE